MSLRDLTVGKRQHCSAASLRDSSSGTCEPSNKYIYIYTYTYTIICMTVCVVFVCLLYICVYIYIYIYTYIYISSSLGAHAQLTSDSLIFVLAAEGSSDFPTACRKDIIVFSPLAVRKPNLVFLTASRPLPFRGHNFSRSPCRKPQLYYTVLYCTILCCTVQYNTIQSLNYVVGVRRRACVQTVRDYEDKWKQHVRLDGRVQRQATLIGRTVRLTDVA